MTATEASSLVEVAVAFVGVAFAVEGSAAAEVTADSGLLADSRLAEADAAAAASTRVEGVARGLDANASPPKTARPVDRDVP